MEDTDGDGSQQIRGNDVFWIHLAQDKYQWRVLMNMIIHCMFLWVVQQRFKQGDYIQADCRLIEER